MADKQTLPDTWLLSDERNDAVLEIALGRLPRRSGFIYRHYHLPDPQRRERFIALRRLAHARDHLVVLADSAMTALEWGADGIYGAPRELYPTRARLIRLATAHDLREIGDAQRFGADAILLSPAFSTNSHPDAPVLGGSLFRLLARHATVPVIALGGMDQRKAASLDWSRWAAIDGLS